MSTFTVHEFLESLRDGKYAHGGYPKYWLASDGETLSYEACRSEVWQIARAIRDHDSSGWRVVACDANWEDPNMYCAHTNNRIESAYADEGIDRDDRTIGAYTITLVELPDYAYALRVKYAGDQSDMFGASVDSDSTTVTINIDRPDSPEEHLASLNTETAIVSVLESHGYDRSCKAKQA